MAHGFLVHDAEDHVGVAVRDLKAQERVSGVYLLSGKHVEITTIEDIPLGHKVALTDIEVGDGLRKYGEVIGTVIRPIRTGAHVHVHNVKSVRWGSI